MWGAYQSFTEQVEDVDQQVSGFTDGQQRLGHLPTTPPQKLLLLQKPKENLQYIHTVLYTVYPFFDETTNWLIKLVQACKHYVM